MPMHGKKKTKKMAKGGATKMRYGGKKTKKMSRGGATRRR